MNKEELLYDNQKYLKKVQSTSYKIIESIRLLIIPLIKGDFLGFVQVLRRKRINLQIRIHTSGRERQPKKTNIYHGEKIAVYTVLFGDIDRIIEPLVVDDNCDYYIVTDQDVPIYSTWKKMEIDFSTVDGYSNRQKNRYYKMHSHELFPDYSYCIYLDANVAVYGLLSDLIQYINPKSGLGIHNMPNRENIYEEIYARSLLNPKDVVILERQKEDYQQKRFEGEDGMFECNVLVIKACETSAKIMERWWEEYKKYPARDQVALPYVLWEIGMSQESIGIIGNCVRLNPYFRIEEHTIV